MGAALDFPHAFGFATGRRKSAGSFDLTAHLIHAFRRVCENVACRIWRRAGLGAARHCRSAQVDDGGRVQRNLRALPFPPRTEHRQSHLRVRGAASRTAGRSCRLQRVGRASRLDHGGDGRALPALRGNRGAAAHSFRRRLCGDRADARRCVPDDDAAPQAARRGRPLAAGGDLCCDRRVPPAPCGRAAGGDSAVDRHDLVDAEGGSMNSDNPVLALAATFALMSLFAIGGANSAIPEMHRVAVDVHHWLTDKQFTDVYAIAQLSPGPNVLIVTLIGYSVAGLAGAAVATLAMCVPTAVLALFVSRFLARSSQARWPAIVQAALVPLSIGLMGASGFILARTSDRTLVAVLVTVAAAVLASVTKLNPLWMLVAGGCLGFAGLIG